MSHKKHKAAAHEEEPENHERWLITYADMITLLMVLFIVLFSIGQVDLAKFQALKHSLNTSFGGASPKVNPVVSGGAGVLTAGSEVSGAAPGGSGATGAPTDSSQAEVALVPIKGGTSTTPASGSSSGNGGSAAAQAEQAVLNGAEAQIEQALTKRGLQDAVTFRTEARGLVVTVVTDYVLYPLDSAVLQPEGRAVLDALAPALAALPNDLSVEGHTDSTPVTGGPYATNWELSTARATAVVRYLIDAHHIDPTRLSATGYADTRPLVPNTNTSNRALNRRVEIVVLNNQTSSAQTGAS